MKRHRHTISLGARADVRLSALLLLALALSACGDRAANGNSNSEPTATRSTADNGSAAGLDAEITKLTQQAEKSPGDDDTLQALSNAYYRRGEARRGAGQVREALSDYQSAIRAFPDNEEAKQRVAEISPQFEGETTGEYGEPAPLPITPNVTTGDEGDTDTNTNGGARPSPTPKKKSDK